MSCYLVFTLRFQLDIGHWSLEIIFVLPLHIAYCVLHIVLVWNLRFEIWNFLFIAYWILHLVADEIPDKEYSLRSCLFGYDTMSCYLIFTLRFQLDIGHWSLKIIFVLPLHIAYCILRLAYLIGYWSLKIALSLLEWSRGLGANLRSYYANLYFVLAKALWAPSAFWYFLATKSTKKIVVILKLIYSCLEFEIWDLEFLAYCG